VIIHCPECSNGISDQANACPHCGNPIGQAVDALAAAVSASVPTHSRTQRTGKVLKCNLCGGSMNKTWDKSPVSHNIAAFCAVLINLFMFWVNWLIALALFIVFMLALRSPKRLLLCDACGHFLPCLERKRKSHLIAVLSLLAIIGGLVWSIVTPSSTPLWNASRAHHATPREQAVQRIAQVTGTPLGEVDEAYGLLRSREWAQGYSDAQVESLLTTLIEAKKLPRQ
jgi:hypothetical protein